MRSEEEILFRIIELEKDIKFLQYKSDTAEFDNEIYRLENAISDRTEEIEILNWVLDNDK